MDNNNKIYIKEEGYKCDPWSQLGQQHILNGIQIVNKDVKDAEANIRYGIKDSEAEVRSDVKDAEANVRHDVLFEGQENQKTSLEVEARLKDRLTIDRNAWDLQFQNLNNRICETDKGVADTKFELTKQTYETRIEALKTADRVTDKIHHAQEEIREDIGALKSQVQECCCEAQVAAVQQTGLLNIIANVLGIPATLKK